MQIPDALIFGLTLFPVSAATWGASRWWYGRKLQAAQNRIEKLHHARLLGDQHTAQVRRQIEHLNRELTTYRAREQWAPTPAPPAGGVATYRPPVAPAPLPPRTPTPAPRSSAADLARLLDAGDQWRATQQQSGGWQATQQTDAGWLATQQIDERPGARAANGFADTLPL